MCGSRPLKAAVAAIAEHLAGLVPTQVTYSHAHQNTAQVCSFVGSILLCIGTIWLSSCFSLPMLHPGGQRLQWQTSFVVMVGLAHGFCFILFCWFPTLACAPNWALNGRHCRIGHGWRGRTSFPAHLKARKSQPFTMTQWHAATWSLHWTSLLKFWMPELVFWARREHVSFQVGHYDCLHV